MRLKTNGMKKEEAKMKGEHHPSKIKTQSLEAPRYINKFKPAMLPH